MFEKVQSNKNCTHNSQPLAEVVRIFPYVRVLVTTSPSSKPELGIACILHVSTWARLLLFIIIWDQSATYADLAAITTDDC